MSGSRRSGCAGAPRAADEAYIASTGIIDVAIPNSALFEPGDGRALYAGVRMRW